MHHVAIMNKKWNLIEKIIDGRKKIESRWYKSRIAPWNKIKKGDVVFFKNAGEDVNAKAEVSEVLQFENLTENKISEIIERYGGEAKICFSDKNSAFQWTKNKKYCILIFLEDVQKIEPFKIDKTGFGNACAWITIEDIQRIAVK
jgi:ASC-1-like (ASCH) protein